MSIDGSYICVTKFYRVNLLVDVHARDVILKCILVHFPVDDQATLVLCQRIELTFGKLYRRSVRSRCILSVWNLCCHAAQCWVRQDILRGYLHTHLLRDGHSKAHG